MKFNIATQMEYMVNGPGTLILNVHALKTSRQLILTEAFTITPQMSFDEIAPVQGEGRLIRFETGDAGTVQVSYKALVDNYFEIKDYSQTEELTIAQMGVEILPYLNPSRYCQSDKLYRLANNMFGHIENPYEKVSALCNWIHQNVQYLSGSTNAQTSAYDTVTQQQGVCRDFAHLGIALCRALTIPARYFTGYAYKLKPADFHACFEAYIGTDWVLFDATGLVPLNGLIKIATGRDAADAALASIFGNISFTAMQVDCSLAQEDFDPVFYQPGQFLGLTYL